MARFALILVLLLALAAAPARAAAGGDLWATVNVCDTAAHPEEIGIRASMPGAPRTRLLMRFRAQYRDPSDGQWRYVRDADSGWRRAGRGRATAESGFSFQVAGDGTRILRGVVDYRWLRKRHAPRRARRITQDGHRSTAGADPADYSAATCRIG
jgi:hypothetical protein